MRSPAIRNLRGVLRNGIVLCAVIAAVWLALPKPPLLDGISFSQCVRDRNGKLLRVTLSADQKFRIWTPLEKISPDLIDATLRYEDKYYARHPGVNPIALARGAAELLRLHRATTGGSTITMQLARLRFHLHTRTISGKLEQIMRALELERHYSKNQILEAYLNLAPYGRNIEGIGAASEIYFDKPASKLSRPEAIALSVIPQSPSRRALHTDRDNHSVNLAQTSWYDRNEQRRPPGRRFDSTAGSRRPEFSMREFRPRMQTERKFIAPHFVQEVLETSHGRDEIVTTLDLEKQQAIERRVTDYVANNRNRGIENAAVFLVDTRTMDVVAQIGSADFYKADINGQVDGTRSPRSPGSTLKPFVYALALEQGLIHPLSILADAPRSFGEYNPENFDREFLGPIRACDALARSRNVPAVELASHLAHPTLYEFLSTADVRLPKAESFYGLGASARWGGSFAAGFGAALCCAREQWRTATAAIHGARPHCKAKENSFAGSRISDSGNAWQCAATGNELRRWKSQRAGLLENGNVAWFSGRLVNRSVRSLRARGLGWKFRWARQPGVCRPHCGRAATVSDYR